jgi:bifunctional DNA-binding transcriptional regulator/antitoxin component of YhaV-PrlF toxin-antitoxin module
MIQKTIKRSEECFIQFTEEEMIKLGMQVGDKFSIDETDDGIVLKKYAKLEIDLSEFPRETLEFLISESCEKDISISEVVENVINYSIMNDDEVN